MPSKRRSDLRDSRDVIVVGAGVGRFVWAVAASGWSVSNRIQAQAEGPGIGG